MYERGFKTWCEKYSATVRSDLGLRDTAPLDPFALAKKLGIKVWSPEDVPGLDQAHLDVLLRNDGKTRSCWSAVTIMVGNRTLAILNTSHSPGRQANDLTHELSHFIRGHRAHEVDLSADGLMLLDGYDKLQEMEADWLSGTLLLPRPALASIARRQLAQDVAASEYGVSTQLLTYRMATTGVGRQYGTLRNSAAAKATQV